MDLNAAARLARELMTQHGLRDWGFHFDRARRRFGSCQTQRKRITLSCLLTHLNEESQVRDTILHEIAHALTPKDGHGEAWRRKCLEIGANPRRCYRDDDVTAPPRRDAWFQIGCEKCGWWVDRHRRTRRKLICRKCRSVVAYRVKDEAAGLAKDLDDETIAAINRAEAQIDRGEGIDFKQFAAEMRKRFPAA